MAFKDRMVDYVPVNERIEAFYAKHPEGTLQSEIVELTDTRVTVKAYAYRSDDDPRPGIGHSSIEIPGSTSFTRGSEIENAETSAWGRAIAALGFEVKRGMASAEEVRNKQPDRSGGPAKAASSPRRSDPVQRTAEESTLLEMIQLAVLEHGISKSGLSLISDAVGVPKGKHANAVQLAAILERIEAPAGGVPVAPGVGEGGAISPSPSDAAQSELSPSPAAPTPLDISTTAGDKAARTVEEAIAAAEARAADKTQEVAL